MVLLEAAGSLVHEAGHGEGDIKTAMSWRSLEKLCWVEPARPRGGVRLRGLRPPLVCRANGIGFDMAASSPTGSKEKNLWDHWTRPPTF